MEQVVGQPATDGSPAMTGDASGGRVGAPSGLARASADSPKASPAVSSPEQTGSGAEPSPDDIAGLIEALLFVAASPAPLARLAQALNVSESAVQDGLDALSLKYHENGRGLRLQQKDHRASLVTAPIAASAIERFLGLDLSSRLSPAALETLAVVAYRQPLTRPQIEAIRGVNCDGVLRTLVARELVEAVGRQEAPGRPFLYGTTFRFLQYFGLESLDSLPALPGDSETGEKGTQSTDSQQHRVLE